MSTDQPLRIHTWLERVVRVRAYIRQEIWTAEGETLLGASSEFASHGLLGVIEDPFGAALCLVLVGLFFARKLYRMNLLTIGDYYRQRYGKGIEVFCSVAIILSYLGWVAAQITALGLVFTVLTNAAAQLMLKYGMMQLGPLSFAGVNPLVKVLQIVFSPWVFLGLKRSRRRKAFNTQLPDTLQLMSGSLAAGLSLAQSVDTIVRDYTRVLERWVRRAPSQYFWHHKRWKHQPPPDPAAAVRERHPEAMVSSRRGRDPRPREIDRIRVSRCEAGRSLDGVGNALSISDLGQLLEKHRIAGRAPSQNRTAA